MHRSLVPHIKRVNYRVAQWKRSDVNMLQVPAPTDHEWALGEDILDPVWSQRAVRPSKVADILDSDMHRTIKRIQTWTARTYNAHSLQTKDLTLTFRDNVNSWSKVE